MEIPKRRRKWKNQVTHGFLTTGRNCKVTTTTTETTTLRVLLKSPFSLWPLRKTFLIGDKKPTFLCAGRNRNSDLATHSPEPECERKKIQTQTQTGNKKQNKQFCKKPNV